MYLKKYTPIYPVVDVGTVEKIKSGEIQVCVLCLLNSYDTNTTQNYSTTTNTTLSLSLSHDVATMDRRYYLRYNVSKITM